MAYDKKNDKKKIVAKKVKKVKKTVPSGRLYRYYKNILKQYPHMKAFEDAKMEMQETPELLALYKKHGLEPSSRATMHSIIHTRWGNASRGDDNRINEVDDIIAYVKDFEEKYNVGTN